jgi:hypothetical protein
MPLTGEMLLREILWRSTDGKHAVVAGPFPHGFVRSLTARTVEKAARNGDLVSRNGTTQSDQYAKVRLRDIAPTSNDLGEICP